MEILQGLHKLRPNWDFEVFAYDFSHDIILPNQSKPIKIRKRYTSIFGDYELTERLKEFDIIYIKGVYYYLIPARRSNKPVIMVVHQIDSIKLFKGFRQKLLSILTIISTPYFLKNSDYVITVTDELKSLYLRCFGIQAKVIPDQFSDIYFKALINRKPPNRNETINLLSVGYWDGENGRKRQDLLLKIIANPLGKSRKIHLTLVGLTADNIKNLTELCINLDIQDKVTLEGIINESDLVERYEKSDVYVTHTTYEGFYRQIIEAFASKMPALVYDSRLIVNNKSQAAPVNHVIKSNGGELFKNSLEFHTKLAKILDNYNLYSSRAFEYAKKFSNENSVNLNVELFESIGSDASLKN